MVRNLGIAARSGWRTLAESRTYAATLVPSAFNHYAGLSSFQQSAARSPTAGRPPRLTRGWAPADQSLNPTTSARGEVAVVAPLM